MKVISVGGPKGGCGKTTLITNLAALAAQRGHTVGLLDADPKPDSQGWVARRNENKADLNVIHVKRCTGEIDDAIISMAKAYDYLFIDTAGMDSDEVRYAIAYSQIFIAPFNPSRYDLETAKHLHSLLRTMKPSNMDIKSYSLLSNASNHKNSLSTSKSRAFIEEYANIPCLTACMHALEVWRSSADTGMGVSELLQSNEGAKAYKDITAIAEEINLWN